MKILMVCLGNICRSPLAEGILRSKLNENFTVDSVGTGNYHIGAAPDKRSIAVAREHRIDISHLKARQLSESDYHFFDKIYCMDKHNYQYVLEHAPNSVDKEKIKLLLEETPTAIIKEVPDPYYGCIDEFEQVYQLIDEACENIANKLLNN